MDDAPESLQKRIQELEAENEELRLACEDAQDSLVGLEQAYGESNAKILRAEMSSMELEQVVQACTDPLWVIREDHIVVRANRAMLAFLGKPLEEVVGKECFELLDYSHCKTDTCPLAMTTKRSSSRDLDIQISGDDDGEVEHYILTSAPLVTLDGSPGIVVQLKNISSRKKAENELAEANAELQRMARLDGLTQIPNRRAFDEKLKQEWDRLAREQLPFSLLLGDIDFFKKFNDTYGHQGGDDCLKLVARALSSSVLRPADMAARYGGEEFALLLPGVGIEGALEVADRALEAVASLQVEHKASTVSPFVSVSLGAASLLPSKDQDAADLVALADEALYNAKEQGRNRVVAAPSSSSAASCEEGAA
ncbi:MAG: hypothetical protein C0617_16090 [Desulfuromonas sp.]|uniref:diguanylate cyclase n=1 Tax=Desulfuromonas sp. TaxID=892 RepID=UPI000CB45F68|nr:diguanylate cyclase [Desulfuromonas sp.]PLX81768.1 MAG: hypothetical protein C0617_16090 [Desulfuromonas sp.]